MAKDNNRVSKEESFPVNVAPEMQLYHVLHHLNYGLETAFAEFIDNSIQSFLENETQLKAQASKGGNPGIKPLCITITVDNKKNSIVIEDNALGIDRVTMQRALRLGNDVLDFHPDDSLSVYGIGMKSSAVWFSKNWQIETSVLGGDEKLSFYFDLEQLIRDRKTESEVNVSDAEASEHYTRIILNQHVRQEPREHYEDMVLPFLQETFFKFLSIMSLRVIYDGTEVTPNPKIVNLGVPRVLEYPPVNKKGIICKNAIIKWSLPIDFRYLGRRVHGFIMLRAVGSYTQPGLRLLRNNRVIEGTTVDPNIPVTLLGTKNKYAAQRIYGELDISSFPVDFMKTNFNENLVGFYQALRKEIAKNDIGNLVEQATYFRKNLVKKEPNKTEYKKLQDNGSVVDLDSNDSIEVRELILPPPTNPSTPDPEVDDDKNETDDQTEIEDTNESDRGDPDVDDNPRFPAPNPDNRLESSEDIEVALELLKEDKLLHLYNSLCTVSLKKHSVMCYVAAWCLLEAITARLGRNDQNDFSAFFGSIINKYCPKDRRLKKELNQVVQDISSKGNCFKHSGRYWNRDALDLKGHFKILEPLLIWMIEDFVSSKSD